MVNNNLQIGQGIPQIGGPQVDPLEHETVACKCGSIVFTRKVILKRIPGTLVGQGVEPVLMPLPVIVCEKCGRIIEEDVKSYQLSTNNVDDDEGNQLIQS